MAGIKPNVPAANKQSIPPSESENEYRSFLPAGDHLSYNEGKDLIMLSPGKLYSVVTQRTTQDISVLTKIETTEKKQTILEKSK